MTSSNDSNSSTFHTSPVYKFRAECAPDAHVIRGVLLPWLLRWKEAREVREHDGQLHALGGVTVEFSMGAGAPDIGGLCWLMDAIPNCHVPAETLSLVEYYTGERAARHPWSAPATRPSLAAIEEAAAATVRHQELMRLQLERAQEAYRMIRTAEKAGEAWPAIRGAAGYPGWVLVLGTQVEGLLAIRSVQAPFGAKNWASMKEKVTGGRVKTLSS